MTGFERNGRRYWSGEVQEKCDLCGRRLGIAFWDARSRQGWGIFCPDCHRSEGMGKGVGHGQAYVRQPDGRWLKVEG